LGGTHWGDKIKPCLANVVPERKQNLETYEPLTLAFHPVKPGIDRLERLHVKIEDEYGDRIRFTGNSGKAVVTLILRSRDPAM
jgi:hypothetical protein